MGDAKDLTIDQKRSGLVCCEDQIITLAGSFDRASIREVAGDRKAVALGRINVYDMNDDDLSQRDVHHGPRKAIDLTVIVPIGRHDNREMGRTRRTLETGGATHGT